MQKTIKQLIQISRFAGERFDLVQAGGGNSSIKVNNDEMLIKASGISLADLAEDKGYARVNYSKIKEIIDAAQKLETKEAREAFAARELKKAQLDQNRPSIETYLHALTDTCTLHTHPIPTNLLMVRKDYGQILEELFDDYVLVEYQTPGIDLAIAMQKEIKKHIENHGTQPKIMFLKNHGLFISASEESEVITLTEEVNNKLADYFKLDLSNYKLTTKLSQFFNQTFQTNELAYCSNDKTILEHLQKQSENFFLTPLFPDQIVYAGFYPVEINTLQDNEKLKEYATKNGVFPKIIVYQDNLYFIAPNLRKAREMEDVFKSHLIVADQKTELCLLEKEELNYLTNWEAEKYRQKV